ncbi:hypothetical protein [Lacticaseibacillus camelliae]|uniref:hypothetical protein n=1 Tax=Lacticaseibacillus camelliae TaxID=381742 RepID=UPI0006D23289|nr:hypothetical protein [Lacticaseibacillus camelliae]
MSTGRVSPLGTVLAWLFLLSLAVFVLSLIGWLITMLRGRDPQLPRRVCLIAAALAMASLAINSAL